MNTKPFALKIDSLELEHGNVCIRGQWLAGTVSGGDTLTLEQDGARRSVAVNSVHIGDDVPELVLVCGGAQEAFKVMREGSKLVGR